MTDKNNRNVWMINEKQGLTLSALQTKPDTCANSVDPDEMACNKPSHQDLHCLPLRF